MEIFQFRHDKGYVKKLIPSFPWWVSLKKIHPGGPNLLYLKV